MKSNLTARDVARLRRERFLSYLLDWAELDENVKLGLARSAREHAAILGVELADEGSGKVAKNADP